MGNKQLIGREEEIRQLDDICSSGKAEFVAVYGRRRIGKTFLVDSYFRMEYDFFMAGMYEASNQEQLANFAHQLSLYSKKIQPAPSNWMEAFFHLQEYLQGLGEKGRVVVFIDELPWFDSPRSRFLKAFELFWNGWASKQDNLKLVVCGSSTSWMTNKLIGNRGGLHNRVTRQIRLRPFNLHETELFLRSKGFDLPRKQIVETYMVMGGTPFYLDMMRRSQSVAQNIDTLFFAENAPLRDEFGFLFKSLFNDSGLYKTVVETLAAKAKGLTRQEIIDASGLADNGYLSEMLENLKRCDFIRSYHAYGKKERDALYQLTDLYSLFYLRFVKDYSGRDEHRWSHSLDASAAWQGYAFEQVCLHHIPQIKKKLGISGIQTDVSSWFARPYTDNDGTAWQGGQIDLLIDRKDGVINLCEMKFSDKEYVITKDYDKNMCDRMATFRHHSKTRKALHQTMVTTFGVAHNAYWNNIQSEVMMDDLFDLA
ncbi:MAG: AAA family ATPase [Bacteroidales bacterium]|nr:AAA family ATPase [Bacteroidales bacterium]